MIIAPCPGGAAELAEVMAVMTAAFDPAFGEAWSLPQVTGVLHGAGAALLVARDGGPVLGFALIRVVLDEAELLLLAVDPAVRRQGTGARLVEAAAAVAGARGATRLMLEVRDGNPAALLYQMAGFVPVGRRTGYYRRTAGAPVDAITLSRPIPGA